MGTNLQSEVGQFLDPGLCSFKPASRRHRRRKPIRGSLKCKDRPRPASSRTSWAQQYGDNTLLETLNGLVTGDHPLSAQYQKLPKDESRKKFVMKIVGNFRKAARARVIEEFPKGSEGDDAEQ
jgi:hypothetical protein